MRILRSLSIVTTLFLTCGLPSQAQTSADVIVYGSTPGGFCAAIAAAREGASVILLEPTQHIGGMNTGGLSFNDSDQMYRDKLMGLFHEWCLRIQQDYEGRGVDLPFDVTIKDLSVWSFEPHVAMRVTLDMLDEAGVTVLTGRYLQSVTKSGPTIMSIVTSNGTYTGSVFIDGSYEGDLMAATGVSWTIGREGKSDFNESYAGKRYPKSTMNINGFDDEGNPLPLITHAGKGDSDAGDNEIMTYSFRIPMTTDPGNKVTMPAPENYDPARFELVRRYIAQHGSGGVTFSRLYMPGNKVDANNAIGSQFSIGLVGGGTGWATADEAGRAEIFEAHKQYTLEFLYFLSNDPIFSASQRASIAQWGLCADEFPDTGHWPPQLYVRESRRMQGLYIMDQNDIIGNPFKTDPIAVGSFPLDSHDCRRVIEPDGTVVNEGTIFPVKEPGVRRGFPYQIPYRSILPHAAECDNLLVPVALSCTHVAISSIRIEATWMVTGQSAGIAAAMAAAQGIGVQALPYADLEPRLLAQGQVLTLPDAYLPPEPLGGIVLDDVDAELAGTWMESTTLSPYIGSGYRYTGASGTPNDGSATATFRFTAPEEGIYQINMAYTADASRATNVPVSVSSGPHLNEFLVDQTIGIPDGSVVREIGTVQLVADQESVITVGTTGTTGFVIVDAIQLVLDGDSFGTPGGSIQFQEGVAPTAGYTHGAVMIRSRADNNNDDTNQDGNPLFVGLAESDGEIIRALLEFDISAIPSGSVIRYVTLDLTTLSSSPGINNVGAPGALTTFNVYAFPYEIDETTATWNAPGGGAPAGGGALSNPLSSASLDVEVMGQVITFENTPAFSSSVGAALADDGFLRLIIANDDESNIGTHDFARFESDDSTTPSARPLLIVGLGNDAIKMTAFDFSPELKEITLGWNSSPGKTYRIAYSFDLIDWSGVLAESILPDAGQTTTVVIDFTGTELESATRVFCRVEEE